MRDTIFALSSGAPPAGVAVIRISGPNVRFGLETLIGLVPAPRVAYLTDIHNRSGVLLDRGLVLFFPGPKSFTGEDVAEFQIHGGRASVSSILSALSDLEAYRPAEPGEFTRRAFENGRMDLTAVEGLSDLIRAETEAQRRQALDQASGLLKDLYDGWARRLMHARAMIEAELDFSDEDDIPGSVTDQIWPEMRELALEIADHLSRAKTGEIVRDGFRVVLIGKPNVGKSSLLNNLAHRDVAIVSETPGTTRDVIETRLDIEGNLVLLLDTAGLRDSDDDVEIEGIRRSMAAAEDADLVLHLCDARHANTITHDLHDFRAKTLIVWTKLDLMAVENGAIPIDDILISNKAGTGIDSLISAIGSRITTDGGRNTEVLPTRERHVHLLRQCAIELENAQNDSDLPIEVRSEYLRNAAVSLGRITGTVDVEDLLGVIFSEFCVGK